MQGVQGKESIMGRPPREKEKRKLDSVFSPLYSGINRVYKTWILCYKIIPFFPFFYWPKTWRSISVSSTRVAWSLSLQRNQYGGWGWWYWCFQFFVEFIYVMYLLGKSVPAPVEDYQGLNWQGHAKILGLNLQKSLSCTIPNPKLLAELSVHAILFDILLFSPHKDQGVDGLKHCWTVIPT